ncbi:MAG: hypothetical protein HY690_02070 [Chloroflexi bacterium]|nr:hypothetical protein [Chloroflexota bacterium]
MREPWYAVPHVHEAGGFLTAMSGSVPKLVANEAGAVAPNTLHQFQGWRHFKRITPSPLNPIELVGGYGHIRPDVLSLTPGPNDRGTRVEVRKALS